MDQLFKEFNKPNASVERVGTLLSSILPAVSPLSLMNPAETNMTHLLEVCCYHAAYTFDGARFEQYFSILFTNHYQSNLSRMLIEHTHSLPLIGMQLLNLLVSNRTNQYHLLLCKLPSSVLLSSVHLRFVLQLEEALREGTFHRVLAAKSQVPAPEYAWFVEGLVERIRTEVIQCLKASYDTLSVQEAINYLLLSPSTSPNTSSNNYQIMEEGSGKTLLMAICQLNHWSIIDDVVHINPLPLSTDSHKFIAHSVLSNNLSYAKQLEAI